MGRYVSSNEFWDKVFTTYSLPNTNRGQLNVTFQEDFGNMSFNHFNTGVGIKFTTINGHFHDDTIVENTNSYDGAFLCFNTGNTILMEDTVKDKRVKWDQNMCWSGKMYKGHECNTLYAKKQNHTFHHIGFDNDLFKELIENNEQYKTSSNIYKGDYIDVKFNNIITNQQKMLLNDLANATQIEGKLQELYIESKLLDLAFTSINSIETPKVNNDIYLSSKDIESLQRAKKILLENMTNPPSLKELSYKSAINEFKLKKGFKQLYGNTVFGFLQEYRLNEAKALLESNDVNIGEASSLVGYKSISHFSKIFKEHFGITPIQIKKESRSYY